MSFVGLALVVVVVLALRMVVVVEGAGVNALTSSATFAAAAVFAAVALAAAIALALAIALAAVNGGFTGEGLGGDLFTTGAFVGDLEHLRGDLTWALVLPVIWIVGAMTSPGAWVSPAT